MPTLEILSPGLIWVIHELLDPADCAALIASAEADGFAEAPVTTSRGPVMDKGYRDNTRVMRDEPALVAALWPRVAPFVAQMGLRLPAVGLNERIRYYRYDPGHFFAPHGDGAFVRDARERSLLTFMIYLNDDFVGGETAFPPSLKVRPETGKALLFRHPLTHEGCVVRAGRKYALRSDVMFRLQD